MGSINLGGPTFASAGSNDGFLAKFDALGNHAWSKRFGDANGQHGRAVAADDAGNVVVAGALQGTADLGGGPLVSAGATDVFVAKLDASGSHVWSKRFGDANDAWVQDLATHTDGSVFLVGEFTGTIDFGGGPLTTSSVNDYDVFVAKLDAAGNHMWSQRFANGGIADAGGVAVDPAGNVLVYGRFVTTIDCGGGPLTSSGGTDVFVAKLDPTGSHLWSKRFGGAAYEWAEGVAADTAGNVVIAGMFTSTTIDFGGGSLASAGDEDLFLAKLDSAGNHIWSKRFGDASAQEPQGVAIDGMDHIVVAGYLTGTIDFGGGPLSSSGSADVFVAQLDAAGDHVWSKRFGNGYEYARSVAVDNLGNVLVTGAFSTSIDFGGGPLVSGGSDDVFLAKLAH